MNQYSKEDTLLKLKELFAKFLTTGQSQLEMYRRQHNLSDYEITNQINGEATYQGQRLPIRQIQRILILEKDVYIHELIECFWNYFHLRTSEFESPSPSGIDRTLFEICYQRVLPATFLLESELQPKIIQSTLCDIGVILSLPTSNPTDVLEEFSDDYDYWLEVLTDQDLKAIYIGLKEQGYPHKQYAWRKHKLWNSFEQSSNNYLDEISFPLAGNAAGRQQSAFDSLHKAYLHLHDFVHGDYTTSMNAIRHMNDKKHIFSMYTLITTVAIQILMTTKDKYLDDSAEPLDDLINELQVLYPSVARHYSHI